MKCPRCGYEWKSRIERPKECPRCKGRMDRQPYPFVGRPSFKIIKEVRKLTPSKLPWATVAIIIVISAGLAFYAMPEGGTTPPVGQPATISVPSAPGIVFAGPEPTYSGIENIYIMQHKTNSYDNEENLSDHENLQVYSGNTAVIEASGADPENIPYENYFDIVVAVKGHTDNMAYVVKENMYVSLTITGAFSDSESTLTTGARYVFGDGTPTYIRVNHIFDNDGNGYKLAAGENIELTVSYYCYQ